MALTKGDISKLKELFYTKRELDQRFSKIDERFNELNKKFDKMYNILIDVMGQLATMRDEQTLSASRVSMEELEERVVAIEQRIGSTGI